MRLLLPIALLVLATPSLASEDDVCPDDDPRAELTGPALLRSISLDLRGVVPTPEEYELLADDGSVPESVIDDWLASPEFAERVVRHHRALLWNNLEGTRFFNNNFRLQRTGNRWYRRNTAARRRGSVVACGDWRNELGEDGRPVEVRRSGELLDEGWVWVNPYWAPDTRMRVCAFDAMGIEVTPRGTDCTTNDSLNDPDCGCGPDLSWCGSNTTDDLVSEALGADVDHRIRNNILRDEPYTDLLTGSTAYVNGPLAHFMRNLTGTATRLRMEHSPYDPATLPDLEFSDEDTWVPVELGPEQSGIFTSPAFLLRFQTNRSRANRFNSAFLCRDFEAPPGGLPEVEGIPTLDLTARDGCKYCHALLEPSASHWGRWSEQGSSYLDPAMFPEYDDACARCGEAGEGCDVDCRRYYVTDPINGEEEPYMGQLAAFKFLEDRHHHHVEQGPSLLVRQGVVDGRLPTCVATKAAQNLLGRPLTDDDQQWVWDVSSRFESADWSYRELVKAIVTSPNYRRVP